MFFVIHYNELISAMGDLFDIANLITTVGVDRIKIKPEPGLPEKSSNEILTELFSTFDAEEEIVSSENTDQQVPNASVKIEKPIKFQVKKKKTKRKHKHKDKKHKKKSKRNSSESNSDLESNIKILLINREIGKCIYYLRLNIICFYNK